MILSCKCKHKQQDKLYGPGMRVHNPLKALAGSQRYRCTVCGNIREK